MMPAGSGVTGLSAFDSQNRRRPVSPRPSPPAAGGSSLPSLGGIFVSGAGIANGCGSDKSLLLGNEVTSLLCLHLLEDGLVLILQSQ